MTLPNHLDGVSDYPDEAVDVAVGSSATFAISDPDLTSGASNPNWITFEAAPFSTYTIATTTSVSEYNGRPVYSYVYGWGFNEYGNLAYYYNDHRDGSFANELKPLPLGTKMYSVADGIEYNSGFRDLAVVYTGATGGTIYTWVGASPDYTFFPDSHTNPPVPSGTIDVRIVEGIDYDLVAYADDHGGDGAFATELTPALCASLVGPETRAVGAIEVAGDVDTFSVTLKAGFHYDIIVLGREGDQTGKALDNFRITAESSDATQAASGVSGGAVVDSPDHRFAEIDRYLYIPFSDAGELVDVLITVEGQGAAGDTDTGGYEVFVGYCDDHADTYKTTSVLELGIWSSGRLDEKISPVSNLSDHDQDWFQVDGGFVAGKFYIPESTLGLLGHLVVKPATALGIPTAWQSLNGLPYYEATATTAGYVFLDNTGNGTIGDYDVRLLAYDTLDSGTDAADDLTGSAAGEVLDLGGGDDTARGQDGDDLLRGGHGADSLLGGLGQDRLIGGDGHDTLLGEAGDDQLDPGAGENVVDGGAGVDTVVIDTAQADATVTNRNDQLVVTTDTGSHRLYNVEFLQFRDGRVAVSDLVPPNRPPVAQDDAVTVSERGLVTLSLLDDNGFGPDSDPDGDDLTVVSVLGVSSLIGQSFALNSGAMVTVEADGRLTYDTAGVFVLAKGETAQDSFTYTIEDWSGAQDSATVTITVTGENDAPLAQTDRFDVADDSVLTGHLMDDNGAGPDTDPDGDALTIFAVQDQAVMVGQRFQLGSGAWLTVQEDGQFTYDPVGVFALGPGTEASDSFTYVLSDGLGGFDRAETVITLNGVDDIPDARQITVSTSSGTPFIGSVFADRGQGGAFDRDGDPLHVALVAGKPANVGQSVDLASGARVVIHDDGRFEYDPNGAFALAPGAVTQDQVLFDVSDGTNTSTGWTIDVTLTGEITELDLGGLFDVGGAPGLSLGTQDDVLTVDGAGDLNGDGIDDLIMGAPKAGGWDSDHGAAYVVYGTRDGHGVAFDFDDLDGSNGFRLTGPTDTTGLGYVVAGIGDMNGDGLDDVAIGASKLSPTSSVRVLFGSETGFDADLTDAVFDGTQGFQIRGTWPDIIPGHHIAPLGDINGDGLSDLFVGTSRAEAFVILGRSDGFDATLDLGDMDASDGFTVQADDNVNIRLASAGDFNGDGIDDILATQEQNTWVIFGDADGFDTAIDLETLDPAQGVRVLQSTSSIYNTGFSSVTSAGDVNGDGYDDLLLGSFGRAAVHIVYGNPDLTEGEINLDALDGSEATLIQGPTSRPLSATELGYSVAAVGDVNADGYDDVLIGDPRADIDTMGRAGESFLVFGKAGGLGAHLRLDPVNQADFLALKGGYNSERSGWDVASAGDFNGNGLPDIAIVSERLAEVNLFFDVGQDRTPIVDRGLALQVDEGADLSGSVLADNGAGTPFARDGAALQIAEVNGSTDGLGAVQTLALGGQLTLHADGRFAYDATGVGDLAAGDTATEVFTFTMATAGGLRTTSTATITVHGRNEVPEARDDLLPGTEDQILTGSLFADNGSGADFDADGDGFTVASVQGVAQDVGRQVTLASGARLRIDADGGYTYDPTDAFTLALGATATDSFSYAITDGYGQTSDAQVTVTLTGVNSAPIARDDSLSGTDSTALSGNVLADNGAGADTDADNDTLQVTAVNGLAALVGLQITLTSGATLRVQSDGSFDYDASGAFGLDGDATAQDSFDYQVSDGMGGTDTATVTILLSAGPGDSGPTEITGSGADDVLEGTAADDLITGNGGLDTLTGGAGDDTILGGAQVDSVEGGDGADSIIGYGGDDLLSGGADDDFIDGKNGDDYIFGRTEDDYLVGWGGRDRLRGNAGDDTMIGGNKNDFLQGGSGADVFVFNLDNGVWGKDYIKDFELGVDRVQVEGFTADDVAWKTLKSGLGVMAILKGGGKIVFNGHDKTDLDSFADWDFV